MKKLILSCCLLILSAFLLAQPGKTPVKPVAKMVMAQPALLKTLNDSASYSIGLSIGTFCKQQGISKPNAGLITRGINDVSGNKPALLTDAACNQVINNIFSGQKPALSKTPANNSKAPLKNAIDSASYAMGYNRAVFFKDQGIPRLNSTYAIRAVNDVLGNKPLLINDQMANYVMNKIIMQAMEEKSKGTIDAGRAFLENNKKRPGVKTTASGLQYEVIKEGTGIKPAAADTFVCNYKGTLIDGTEFDNSYKRNQPLIYPVTSVIRGWTEGLQLMPVGSKYNFYIPYELGYGAYGSPPAIPGGAVLIFEVELLDVKQQHKATEPAKPGN